ncbi:MAG TPA: hypothetical protein VIJ33_10455 [Solirubrobacteraceae bacterium]
MCYKYRALHSGFYIGLAVGVLAVVVVVVLVARILLYASRIADQAQTAAEALEVVCKSTDVLPEARHINEHALAILQGAQTARGALTG